MKQPTSKGKKAATSREAKDVVWALARNIVRTGYDDLPREAVDATKKSILDTLGVIEAASGITPGLDEIVGLVKEAGGTKESTILGFGGRVPAWMAAFANGAMAHCLDYDDTMTYGHPSANTVPSGFAVAERVGKVSGKDFITAVAVGNDLFCRFCFSVGFGNVWHRTTLFGVFAAAATSSKLLGLNEAQVVDALGLAFCQTAGTLELRTGTGSDIGGMRDAFPNKGGVLAALLAQRGIRGVRTCFEGKSGLLNAYYQGEYDRSTLTKGLGKVFRGADASYKPWPACGENHSYIDAALTLVKEHHIRPEDVAEVTVFIGDATAHLCTPLDGRRKPLTTMDAKYSIPFSTAVAIAKGRVVVKSYSPEGIKDPAVLAIAQKVTPRVDKEYDRKSGRSPGKVEIKMKDGKAYSKHTDFPYGHPKRPMTWEGLVEKFKDCVSYAANPLPRGNATRVINAVSKLEEIKDVALIVRLLA